MSPALERDTRWWLPGIRPISAWVGLNGTGKTLGMVQALAVPELQAGGRVVANFDVDGGQRFTSWRELSSVWDSVVLLDEMQALFPARQFNSLPPELSRLFAQLRKHRCTVAWASPSWADADVGLRRVTQTVVYCQGYWPKRQTAEQRRRRQWPEYRLFRYRTYPAERFEDFDARKTETVRSASRKWYLRERHAAQGLYRTGEEVELLDHLDATGVCVRCDGVRRRHKCTCTAEEIADFFGLDAQAA